MTLRRDPPPRGVMALGARPRPSRRRSMQEMMLSMSTESPSGDSQQPGGAGASEPDAEEFMQMLRSAPAEEIMAELFSTLLSTAQVKLGRRDARLFIDLCFRTLEYAGPHLPEELSKEVESALGQLRLAQVSAENKVAKKGEPEPNDLSRIPAPPPIQGNRLKADSSDQPASQASKLWIPGR